LRGLFSIITSLSAYVGVCLLLRYRVIDRLIDWLVYCVVAGQTWVTCLAARDLSPPCSSGGTRGGSRTTRFKRPSLSRDDTWPRDVDTWRAEALYVVSADSDTKHKICRLKKQKVFPEQ